MCPDASEESKKGKKGPKHNPKLPIWMHSDAFVHHPDMFGCNSNIIFLYSDSNIQK
jgi:hypothetical protein